MYILGIAVVIFIIVQSTFFLVKAWKQGKKLGMSAATLRNTVTSSAIFTIAPATAIVATVITLAYSLGFVLPWIRLTVIGNISYEATAAESAMEGLGITNGMSKVIEDKTVFSAVAWVMTIGSVFPLVLLPIFLKKLQKKVGNVAKSNKKWADLMTAAAFIGLISAFVVRALAGAGDSEVVGDGAGVLSVITLVAAIVIMLVSQFVIKRFKLDKLEPFAMPLSMIAAMGVAMLAAQVLPYDIAYFEWRG